MMKATFPSLCLCMLVAACQSNPVSVEPAEHQRAMADSLQYIEGSNKAVRQAVKSGDYIVVERASTGFVYYYKGKSYPDAASIPPVRQVGFVYFRGLMLHEWVIAGLGELRAAGVEAPYFVTCHNGLGNVLSRAAL